MSEEGHVHVLTDCKACGLSRMAEGKNRETHTVVPADAGIPEVPATYTYLAEGAHENKHHNKDLRARLSNKGGSKRQPYFTPMTSRIVNFTHGKDHNEA